MTTSDWAIIISFCSLALALASFVWNVWSKFIYPRARLDVSFRKMALLEDQTWSQDHLSLYIVNHGPTKTKVHCATLRERDSLLSKHHWALLNPIHDFPVRPYRSIGPFSGGLPKELDVGESLSLFFPYEELSFLNGPITKIGVTDVFGAHHWAPRKQLQEALKQFRTDFPNAPCTRAGVSSLRGEDEDAEA